MKNNNENYYLGLDIGTGSVGWAVTDTDYKLKKFNGKAMWGVRLFEGGKTAEERRLHRSSRRRQQRRVERIKLLQDIFSEEISKIDMGFFMRMQESKYHLEDKELKDKYSIFADKDFSDIEYHKNFPTIYHLRKALVEGKEEYDIRLLYLAIHHILKHRGHFLFEGRKMENITDFELAFNELSETLNQELDLEIKYSNLEKIQSILKSTKMGVNDKKRQLKTCLDNSNKQIDTFMALISGAKVKLSDLFDDDNLKDVEIKDICFSHDGCDEKILSIEDIIPDRVICIKRAKAVFDWSVLEEIRKGNKYISFSKVADYEKHLEDLKKLKKYVKSECPEKYEDIFLRKDIKGNYPSYVKTLNRKSEKITIDKYCNKEDFYEYLKEYLPEIDSEEAKYIFEEIKKGTFMPKQTNKKNGIIPYQMHLEELETILGNASSYLKFLDEEDEDGFAPKEKIKMLLTFRIPYYVGPLNPAHQNTEDLRKGNSWIARRSNEKINPWNFNSIVDENQSAENFIRRMTNKCTYLIGEDVLPKDSMIYSEFMVLNELNNLKINGEAVSIELKNKIFDDMFTRGKKVTGKQLEKYLITEGEITKNDEISGFDIDFKSNLKSYSDFKRILGNRFENNQEMIEEMILWICLFGENKKMLGSKLEKYKNIISKEEIEAIKNLKYSGWGRLSKKFLTELYHHKDHGEVVSIMSMLKETNDNLMQLLSSKYDFAKKIEESNNSLSGIPGKIEYEMIENLYVSPAVRRSIWQTLEITREIVKVSKGEPEKIFIEVAREDGEKKRTKSRKTQLLELYKSCRDEERDWIKEIESKEESEFRSEKIYLYYTQMGKCMYTGKTIELNSLFDDRLYNIDHIYPRSKTKDDSIDNKVLVYKYANDIKSDFYPINPQTQNERRAFWSMLHDKKYISSRKHERLTRTKEFSDSELADFIARQLVETRQSTKAVAQILKQVFPATEIVYSKAKNITDFKNDYKIIKVREINDHHHADDAYLNIVVGNVYNTKFTNNPVNFIKNKENRKYSLKKVFDFDVERNGKYAWKIGKEGSISTVKKVLSKNNKLFTRYSYTEKGGLFDQNIMRAGKGQLPVKSSDKRLQGQSEEDIIRKYGGYNNVYGAYFSLVEHNVKNKSVRSIEHIPVYLVNDIEKNPHRLNEYFENDMKLDNPKILIPKIKKDALFEVNGLRMCISGRTGDQITFSGATPLFISREYQMYLKKLIKYVDRAKPTKKDIPITEYDKITESENLEIYDLYLDKQKNNIYKERPASQVKKFEDGRDTFINLTLDKQCEFLVNALDLFKCRDGKADLSLIGGSKNAGILKISNKINNTSKIKIIYQSPTGLFEKAIDLQQL